MNKTFEESHARYRSFLIKFDCTEDLSEKNELFRQLTAQLSELENRLSNNQIFDEAAGLVGDDAELSCWI